MLMVKLLTQAVSPAVTSIWENVPVLGSQSDVCVRPCELVANPPLPYESLISVLWACLDHFALVL